MINEIGNLYQLIYDYDMITVESHDRGEYHPCKVHTGDILFIVECEPYKDERQTIREGEYRSLAFHSKHGLLVIRHKDDGILASSWRLFLRKINE